MNMYFYEMYWYLCKNVDKFQGLKYMDDLNLQKIFDFLFEKVFCVLGVFFVISYIFILLQILWLFSINLYYVKYRLNIYI